MSIDGYEKIIATIVLVVIVIIIIGCAFMYSSGCVETISIFAVIIFIILIVMIVALWYPGYNGKCEVKRKYKDRCEDTCDDDRNDNHNRRCCNNSNSWGWLFWIILIVLIFSPGCCKCCSNRC